MLSFRLRLITTNFGLIILHIMLKLIQKLLIIDHQLFILSSFGLSLKTLVYNVPSPFSFFGLLLCPLAEEGRGMFLFCASSSPSTTSVESFSTLSFGILLSSFSCCGLKIKDTNISVGISYSRNVL